MKTNLYRLLSKFGYKVENRNKRKSAILKEMRTFDVTRNIDLLFRQYESIKKLWSIYPDLSIKDKDAGVLLSFAGLSFYAESGEEIYIICEIFYDNDYNFLSNDKTVLIDIGANIGVASIFFSTRPNIKKIYAFEPVSDTFVQAKANFAMNNLQNIKIENIGLGKNDREETFLFNKSIKGNTGVRGTLSASYAKASQTEERLVQIRDAGEVFSEIMSSNPSEKLVVKMDCEGAEYEIMDSLHQSGILSKIDAFLIEWHDKGPADLESKLVTEGFFVFSRTLTENSGMIYAKKNAGDV